MSAWNETHYARARAFISLLAETIAASAAETPDLTAVPFHRPAPATTPVPPPAVAPAPAPTPPPAPAVPAPVTAAITAPATAAGLFKKMPWKK